MITIQNPPGGYAENSDLLEGDLPEAVWLQRMGDIRVLC
jgi:hypothetical protein